MRPSRVSLRFAVVPSLLLALTAPAAFAAPNALHFNGSTQYVTFGAAPTLNTGTFTIELWFKREGAGVATSTGAGGTVAVPLIAKGRADADASNRDANYFLGIRSSDSLLVADYEEGTAAGQASPGLNHPIAGVTKIRNDVWYHAAATFDGSHWRLYLNGAIEKDTTLAGNRMPQIASIEHASIATAITSASSSPVAAAAGFFLGTIEEPRIWNVARPQQGILDSMVLQIATAPGLIGRWALDEGTGTAAASTVGGAPSGTLSPTGTPPVWVVGGGPFAIANALQLIGTNGYVNFGNPASLKLSELTIETWFRRDGAGAGTNTGAGGIPDLIPIVSKGRAESEDPLLDINYILGIRASDGRLCFDFEEGASGSSPSLNHPIAGLTVITNGIWHHVAVTYDGARWKLYLDGNVEKDSLIGAPLGSGSDVSVALGSALNSGATAAGFFNGALAETRIWNRARTQAEVIADLNAQITAPRTGLVARWALNEGGGTVIRGSAGTTVNGTLVGTGSGWTLPAPFNLVPPAPPAAPTGFSAIGQTFASILLQWTDTANNELNFEIERSTTGVGGPFSPLVTVASNVTSYVDAGLSENSEYCYRVRATNAIAPSSYATASCATTQIEQNRALVFAGTNAYARLGNPPALNLGQFTLECWFRRDGASVGTNTGGGGIPDVIPFIAKGRAETESPELDINYIFGIRASDGVLCADFEEAATGPSPSLNHPVAGFTPITNGTWHHGAVTYDGNQWQLFLDGNLERQLPVGRPVDSADTIAVALGSALNSTGAASGFFNGPLDEVRIWNYARSVTEIQSTINSEIRTVQTGLVGRWGLNEGAGATISGGAGTAVNGRIFGTGFSWITPGAPFSIPPPTAPDAPSNLSATPLTEGQIQLQWVDHANNELAFEIERSSTGPSGSFTLVGSVTANTLTFIDTGLDQLSEYCYRVRATNQIDVSGYTSVKCATTPAEPNKSLDLGGSDAYVAFGDPATLHLPAFTIETWFRRDGLGLTATTGSGGVIAVPLVTKGVAEDDNSTVDLNFFLGVRGTDGVLVADFEEGRFGTTPGLNHPVAGVTSIVIGPWYHAAATYDGNRWQLFLNGNLERELVVGEPPQSQSVQRVALGSAVSSQGAASGAWDGTIDEARLWNYARTPTQILETINSQIIAAQSGLVARWSLNEGTGAIVRSSAGTTVTGNIVGENYLWTDGAPFDVPPPTPPTEPGNFSATALTFSQIQLAWTDASNNELSFEIERSTSGPTGAFSPLVALPAGISSYIDGSLNELSEYCYQIRATNTAGPSSLTPVSCATTPAEPSHSLDLGGTDAYVTFGDPDSLDLQTFTVETWFRRDGAGVSTTTGSGGVDAIPLVTHGTSEVDQQDSRDMNFFLGIELSLGVLVADFEEGSDGATPGLNHPVLGTTPIQNGLWYHAAVTYDGGTWRLYLNGTLENDQFVGESPRWDTIQPAALGTGIESNGVPEGFFDGRLDEPRIWSYARSEAQIQSALNTQIKTAMPGLVGRWGLNEGSGTAVSGSGGTAIPGTIQGSNFTWADPAPFNIVIQHPPAEPDQPSPAHQATQVSTSPNLSVHVADPDAENLTVTFYGRPVAGAAGADFTLIHLPDTQFYTSSKNGGTPAILDAQTNWIVANKTARNIVDVIQTGDCTDDGDTFEVEWQNADRSFQTIENPNTTGLLQGLPYTICVGNHDQTANGDAAGTTTFFNQYFGISRFQNRTSYYGGHFGANYDNHYTLFSASGLDFIVISMEYDTVPDAAVLAWADQLLTQYSNRRAIVASHYILNSGNPGTFGAQGQAIYNALRGHSNLFLMLCSHVTPPEGRRSDTFNGNTIYTVMADYQGRTRGGDGWLRILEFSPANNVIRFRTYSPTLNQFETDADSSSQFTIPYDLGGGAPYQVIATRTGVASGSTVSVPWPGRAAAAQYDWYATVSDGAHTATSDAWRFTTIDNVAPTVTVTSPNGGESWVSSSHHNVTWTATDNNTVDSVAISVSTNGGTSYNVIASGLPNTGTYDWVVPPSVGTTNRVRVIARDPSGNSGNDASNANFTITDGNKPTVAVTSPVGGESWEAGSSQILTWSATDNVAVTTVDLAYSVNGGAAFTVIANAVANTGSRAWTVPAVATATARVRIIARDAAGNTARDSSAADFAIVDNTAPLLSLTSPNGGESWAAGSSHNVTWTATDNVAATAIDLKYSTDGGATYPGTIATGIANSGSFAWTLPGTAGTTTRVSIVARDAAGNSSTASSAANFTITPEGVLPLVTVSAPNGGESWATGTHHNITWTASDNSSVESVDIALSTNGGSTFPNVIATAIPNSGTFDWLVASNVATNTMRVRVTAIDPSGNTGFDASNANFTITDADRPVVTLAAPDGGEGWGIGTSQTITWNATDNVAVTTVDLAYSTNGGATFPNVIAAAIANTGSRVWVVPNTPSTTARVRVIARDAAGNLGRDSSSANFTILDNVDPVVSLTAPNGGEVWGAGTAHAVTWTASDNVAVSAIDLKYSTDGGATYPNAIATGIANSGTFNWTLPGTVGTTVRVMVTARDAAARSASDSSAANFTITPEAIAPVVTVSAPNGGESWATGSHHNITWTATDASGVASVDIAYSTNGGTTYPNVIATAIANTSPFDWVVPSSAVGTTLRVRVSALDTNGNIGLDASNTNFTVTDGDRPLVTLSVPAGGETWGIGTSQTITWIATDNVAVTTVDLAYSTNGGATFPNVIATAIANTGSRVWVVPNTPTGAARVRVIARDAAGNLGRDSSSANFTIVDNVDPVVALTSPNGGEGWAAGTSHPVTWTASDNVAVSVIDLEYSTDGGATFPNPIATGIANSGSFAWIAPATTGNTLRVRVIARDAAGHTAMDSSNADFRITPEAVLPLVTVSAPNGGESWVSGTHHNITWTASDNISVAEVDIASSSNGGTTYSNVIATAISNTGTFDWLVPATSIGTTMRVRVVARDPSGNSGNDASNANFTITDGERPTATLTIPAGGESWNIGSSQTITWNATDNLTVTAVDLAYSTNGGATFPNVIATGIANTGSRVWVVPNTPTGTARVRIIARDAAGNTARDSSSANFEIVDDAGPQVTLNAPNGGENWGKGSVQNITWSASDNVGVSAIDLAYSTDGGATYPNPIATGIANTGAFAWTLPFTLNSTMRVQVTAHDAAGHVASDASNGDFAVVEDPNLVGNPGFESNLNLTGWGPYGSATLTQALEGHGGARALQLRGSSSSSFGCDDIPDWINPVTAKGAIYRVSAWVRTPTSSRGSVRLRIYEYVGSSQQGSTFYSPSITLPAVWTLITTDYTVRTANSHLSLRIVDSPSSSGETFLVDDVSIKLLSSPPPDAAPVVTAPATVNATAGSPLTFTVSVSDIDGPAISSFTQSGKPSAATFSVNSARTLGTFTWTPSASDVRAAPYVVTFAAANVKTSSAITNITVNPAVDRAPVVVAPLNVTGSVGFPITFNVTASDPDGQAISSLLPSNMPSAATFTPNATTTGTFSWTPTAADVSNTPYAVTFTASNALNGSATTNITVGTAPPNLAGNGAFDSGTTGWGTYGNAALSVATGAGRSGNALQVTGSSSFGTDDIPDWIPSPVTKNAVYRISCWVKGVGSASGIVKIRVYEFLGSSQQGSTAYSQQPALNGTWQPLTIDYTVRVQGTYLSIRITDAASSATESYLVDDVVMQLLASGALLSSELESASAPGIEPVSRGPRVVAAGATVLPRNLGVPLALRLEALPQEMEREVPALSLRYGTREIAAMPDHTVLGGDLDGNGIEEAAAAFAPADVLRLLGEPGFEDRDIAVEMVARAGEGLAVTAPLTLRVEGRPLEFAATFSPNPVRTEGVLSFSTTRVGSARVDLFDVNGRNVRCLMNERSMKAGLHHLGVDARAGLPAGLYFYRIQAGEGEIHGRFVLMN